MDKPLLVYAGHSYHRTTESSAFFLELLNAHFRVHVIWDEGWRDDGVPLSARQINVVNPDVVVFYQTYPSGRELRKVHCPNLFYVAMHDHVVLNPTDVWPRLRGSGLRVINFCRATHQFFERRGYQSLLVRYWPTPQRSSISRAPGLRVFFWIRKRNLGWPVLKTLLGDARPERLIIRASADPGESLQLPDDRDIEEYRIELLEGWMDRPRYLQLLQACNVFLAPRRFEGIGMSFLEAMASGLLVVAVNNPSMNEYIRDRQNGLLFEFPPTAPLSFSNLDVMREQALNDVASGIETWHSDQLRIVEYLRSPASRGPSLLWRLRARLER